MEKRCNFCPKEFSTVSGKKKHEQLQHTLHNCGYCSAYFSRKPNKIKHEKEVHGAEKNSTKLEPNVHIDESPVIPTVHVEVNEIGERKRIKFVCQYCSQCFNQVAHLRRHQNNKHIPEKKQTYECKYCHKSFSTNYSRIRHEEEVHKVFHEQEDTLIKCIECNFIFSAVKYLREHRYYEHNEENLAFVQQFKTHSGMFFSPKKK
ncbi:unnamed protein product, partial [Meganyctiphanes norvegica]